MQKTISFFFVCNGHCTMCINRSKRIKLLFVYKFSFPIIISFCLCFFTASFSTKIFFSSTDPSQCSTSAPSRSMWLVLIYPPSIRYLYSGTIYTFFPSISTTLSSSFVIKYAVSWRKYSIASSSPSSSLFLVFSSLIS